MDIEPQNSCGTHGPSMAFERANPCLDVQPTLEIGDHAVDGRNHAPPLRNLRMIGFPVNTKKRYGFNHGFISCEMDFATIHSSSKPTNPSCHN